MTTDRLSADASAPAPATWQRADDEVALPKRDVWRAMFRGSYGIANGVLTSDRGEMVVLDEHSITQVEPMIAPAAVTHRRFLQVAQPGRGFSRIDDRGVCSRDVRDIS